MQRPAPPERKVGAATLGAAVGAIADAVLVSGAGLEWWPQGSLAVIATFVAGYFTRNA